MISPRTFSFRSAEMRAARLPFQRWMRLMPGAYSRSATANSGTSRPSAVRTRKCFRLSMERRDSSG